MAHETVHTRTEGVRTRTVADQGAAAGLHACAALRAGRERKPQVTGTKGSEGGRVLVVDDDVDILTATRLLLKRSVGEVIALDDPDGIEAQFRRAPPDVVLLDMNFGPGRSDGREGLRWLDRILQLDADAVVVLITVHGGVETAVEAMKRGATDFVVKPWANERLLATVKSGLTLRHSRQEGAQLRKTHRELAARTAAAEHPIVGRSAAVQDVMSLVARAAPSDANVLIVGENGTGKELVARALHRGSRRADEVFMSIDLGSISESVFESELFGHVKGAFTDARSDRAGRLVAASGGTLFLDEIGNLPLHLQSKLLTVLEQRKVTPVGANTAVPIDVRVVSATNRSPTELADPTIFRTDLLFRLNTVEIRMPPLRERPDDIPDLVTHFLDFFERKYGAPSRSVAPSALEALKAHTWPGNIRALRHAVERAVILAQDDRYERHDFLVPTPAPSVPTDAVPEAESDELNLERVERRTIERALRRHRYNISRTAKELGLTRATLYRRMEKHGL